MALVHEYVWYVLAGALLLGFVLAWVLRGLKKSPDEQRAIVDRDIALLELQQTKDELDSLFAAQRKWKAENKAAAAEGADPALKAEIERLQAELAAMKEQGVEPPAATEAAAPAPSTGRTTEEASLRNALIARNEYLEERIHDVELRLHEMAKSAAKASEPVEAASESAGQGKEAWLASYLTLRAEALQGKLLSVQSKAEAERDDAPAAGHGTPGANGPSERDEEVARLRWRNRYLESRLAYLDQPAERAAPARPAGASMGAPAANPVQQARPSQPAPRPVQAVRPPAPASQPRPNPDAKSPDRFAARGPRFSSPMSALASAGAAQQTAAAPSARPADEKPVQPPAREAPGDAADDLTRISGLSSSIELKLNEIGVWHFKQISEWSQANLAWIDEAFGLDGQAKREDWISQARQLAG